MKERGEGEKRAGGKNCRQMERKADRQRGRWLINLVLEVKKLFSEDAVTSN